MCTLCGQGDKYSCDCFKDEFDKFRFDRRLVCDCGNDKFHITFGQDVIFYICVNCKESSSIDLPEY